MKPKLNEDDKVFTALAREYRRCVAFRSSRGMGIPKPSRAVWRAALASSLPSARIADALGMSVPNCRSSLSYHKSKAISAGAPPLRARAIALRKVIDTHLRTATDPRGDMSRIEAFVASLLEEVTAVA